MNPKQDNIFKQLSLSNSMKSRYSRQELLKQIGTNGQQKISNATVAIVGVGALGSVSAELLVRSGIKKLILIDHDEIELSNLQRQALYTENDVGVPKVLSAKKHLENINKKVKIDVHFNSLRKDNINLIDSDIIIDGTDNIETRFLINTYAKKNNIPYIYGAAGGFIGITFNIINDGACLNCILKNAKNFATCDNEGVLNATTHITASIQVSEAIKIITENNHSNEIIRFNLLKNTFDNIKVKKDKDCEVCNKIYRILDEKEEDIFKISECKTKSSFITKPNKRMNLNIKNIVKEFETIQDAGIIAVITVDKEEIIVHDYGELLFKTWTDTNKIRNVARKIYELGLK